MRDPAAQRRRAPLSSRCWRSWTSSSRVGSRLARQLARHSISHAHESGGQLTVRAVLNPNGQTADHGNIASLTLSTQGRVIWKSGWSRAGAAIARFLASLPQLRSWCLASPSPHCSSWRCSRCCPQTLEVRRRRCARASVASRDLDIRATGRYTVIRVSYAKCARPTRRVLPFSGCSTQQGLDISHASHA